MSIEKDIQSLTATVQKLLTFLENNPNAIPKPQALVNPNPVTNAAATVEKHDAAADVPVNAEIVPPEPAPPPEILEPEDAAQIIAANQRGFTPQVVAPDGQTIDPQSANAQTGQEVQQPEPVATLTIEQMNKLLQAEMARIGDHGMPIIIGILQRNGSGKLSEIDPARYAALLEEIQAVPPQYVPVA